MIKQGLKNSFWTVIDTVLYIFLYLAALPVLMRHLGKESFGFWIFLNAFMAVLQILHMNTGVAATRNVSFHAATSNREEINKTINSVFAINITSGVIIIVAGSIAGILEQTRGLFGIRDSQPNTYFTCFILASLISVFRGFYPTLQGIFKAYGKFSMAAILNTISRSSLLALNVLLVLTGYGVTEMLWANLILAVLFLAVQVFFLFRLVKSYKFSFSFSRWIDRDILSYSFWPWLQSLFVIIAFQTDRFWVTAFSGLEEVSSYGLVSTLFNYIHMVFLALVSWVLPDFSRLTAKSESSEILYRKATSILFIAGIPCLLLFYFISPVLVGLWAGKETYAEVSIYIRAYTIFQLMFLFTIMPFYYFNAAGKGRLAAIYTIGYCLLSYICMLAALFIWKQPVYLVYGMAASLCISMPVLHAIVNRNIAGSNGILVLLKEVSVAYFAIAFLLIPQPIPRIILAILMVAVLIHNFAGIAGNKEKHIGPGL